MAASRAPCLRTQRAVFSVFATMIVVLLALYLVAPAIYVEALNLDIARNPHDSHPLAISLFLVAILALVTFAGVGVARLALALLAAAARLPRLRPRHPGGHPAADEPHSGAAARVVHHPAHVDQPRRAGAGHLDAAGVAGMWRLGAGALSQRAPARSRRL